MAQFHASLCRFIYNLKIVYNQFRVLKIFIVDPFFCRDVKKEYDIPIMVKNLNESDPMRLRREALFSDIQGRQGLPYPPN